VEYAQEAVKQGSVVVGLVNKTHAVLVGLKVRRPTTEKEQTKPSELTYEHPLAQRRRALLVPEEDHRDRLSHGDRHRRPRIRRPRPLKLHEAAVPRLEDDLRPAHPPGPNRCPDR
jgi:hypothetical protein